MTFVFGRIGMFALVLSLCFRGTAMLALQGINIVPQFLTLLLLLFIYFVVFLYVLFGRKKNEKRPAHGLSKSFKALARELPCNITHPPFPRRLCLPFQSREQKNSLHALPASYGTHAQTLLFLFLNWNWHALLLKRCRISFWYYLLFATALLKIEWEPVSVQE